MCAQPVRPRQMAIRTGGAPNSIRPTVPFDVHVMRMNCIAANNRKRREMGINTLKFERVFKRNDHDVLNDRLKYQQREQMYKKMKLNPDSELNVVNPISLAKLAYMSCSQVAMTWYNTKITPRIDAKDCCYLLKQKSSRVMSYAIANKHYDCFKLGHKAGFKLPEWSCYMALASDCVDILKYSHFHQCDFELEAAYEIAAINGSVSCLDYVHKVGGVLTIDLMKTIIINGNLECLKYLLKNGCTWTDDMCALSATSGDLELVKYCHANGCPWVVENSSDWDVFSHNYAYLKDVARTRYATLIEGMKSCVRYIERTAQIKKHCKLGSSRTALVPWQFDIVTQTFCQKF